MFITQIVIHNDIVNEFKQKALRAYPNECISAILGKQVMDTLYIYALDDLSVNRTNPRGISYQSAEEEIEAGTNLKYFGTIHTHSNAVLTHSYIDKKGFIADQFKETNSCGFIDEILEDRIMGIMAIADRKKVFQWGLIFFNEQMQQIETLISESKEHDEKR